MTYPLKVKFYHWGNFGKKICVFVLAVQFCTSSSVYYQTTLISKEQYSSSALWTTTIFSNPLINLILYTQDRKDLFCGLLLSFFKYHPWMSLSSIFFLLLTHCYMTLPDWSFANSSISFFSYSCVIFHWIYMQCILYPLT